MERSSRLHLRKFQLYNKGKIKIYYAPHNEIINDKAKIFIVGITPGWTQTSIAYKTAHEGLKDNLTTEQIKQRCKRNSRFVGSMRKNLIKMLDELNLNIKLNINSCLELFEDKDYLLHTTSIIPYPVFINNKNYTGSNPKIMDNEVLYSYVKKYFYKEVSKEMGFTALKTNIAVLNAPYDNDYLNKNFNLNMLSPIDSKETIYKTYTKKMILSTLGNEITYKN